ncbi:germination protein YpeB [Clostridium tepidum]|jgi:germination protein YpeB|uniref:Germination protein YpeB n=1 Tax=Clostridium tepidum TaxID=1962263 RepID=A0A1S9I3W1_9CLOT|nr:germination protein YpeB [Clostridium tepidum]MCR1935609.1 germination protein YpeB [Clostridium tepidum]MDU6877061.1 germination protein YpeB [Clostridium botulinum]OOO62932.1 germination protein YpeB [Clostridium tepidum]OOO65027.1 germination protein YpeB [Clostridium tepidum]
MKKGTRRILYTLVVTLIVVFSSTFAILMTLERNDYRNYLQGEYSKNLHELITSVQNIRVNLSKAPIIGSREQEIITFEEIFKYSSVATDKLHSLPIDQNTINNTSKFLTQVGDFSNSLAKSIVKDNNLSQSDYDNIEKLKKESLELENQLNNVVTDINEGRVRWGDIRKKVGGVLAKEDPNSIKGQFNNIQKQVMQYPSLIYDGPFSDNVLEITPRINSQKKITEKEAKKIAQNIIGSDRIESIKLDKNQGKTTISTYRFIANIKDKDNKKDNIICEISKNGGKLVYLIDSRSVGQPKIDTKKAINIGNEYLKKLQVSNMIPTYTLNYDNVAVINYVYKEDDVIIYPDQIKLKIALDKGEVIGAELEKYLVSHHDRNINKNVKITKEEAQKRVGKNLNITNVRLSIIPTEVNTEVLCYEFSGTYKNDKFKIFINANTGYEERILQILDTPNGKLTI